MERPEQLLPVFTAQQGGWMQRLVPLVFSIATCILIVGGVFLGLNGWYLLLATLGMAASGMVYWVLGVSA